MCVGVECVFEKLCFRLSEVEGGLAGGKGFCACIIYFQVFFLLAFYLLRILFPHFFHFESFLSHLLPLSHPLPCVYCRCENGVFSFLLVSYSHFFVTFFRRRG